MEYLEQFLAVKQNKTKSTIQALEVFAIFIIIIIIIAVTPITPLPAVTTLWVSGMTLKERKTYLASRV